MNVKENFEEGLVSIIIPTHNRASMLSETILSIFAQTYNKIELLVIDDNSTDNTEHVVKELISESNLYRFVYLKSTKKGGQCARNMGLLHSHGEYIQFFDDDDIMTVDHVECKVNALVKNPEAGFVTCNLMYFCDKISDIVSERCIDSISHNVESHVLAYAFTTAHYCCRRSAVTKIGIWNENLLKLQDFGYFHRLFLNNVDGIYLHDKLVLMRQHQNNISSNRSKSFFKSMINSIEAVDLEWVERGKKTELFDKVLSIYKFLVYYQAFAQGYRLWSVIKITELLILRPRYIMIVLRNLCKKIIGSQLSMRDLFYNELLG